MNIKRGRIVAVMTLVLSLLGLYASLTGVLDKRIYEEVVRAGSMSDFLLVGAIAQDIISIPLAIILALLSILFLIRSSYKSLIAIIGLAWYFFYAYGLYVLQGLYSSIYIVYLVIFGLSIYSMIWGLLSFNYDYVKHSTLPGALSKSIGAFLILILLVLVPGWLIRMSIDVAKHVPGDTYAVFIMDLCVVFPALGQITAMLFLKKPFGYTLAGVALIKSFTLCMSWSFSQWFSPFYGGFQLDYGMTAISTVLTVVSLILLVPYLKKLKNFKNSMSSSAITAE